MYCNGEGKASHGFALVAGIEMAYPPPQVEMGSLISGSLNRETIFAM
jgi:hypothetical protein